MGYFFTGKGGGQNQNPSR